MPRNKPQRPKPGSARALRRPELDRALQRVRLFLCDVDGVLTDGSVFIGGEAELKRFHIRDGLGLVMLRDEGFKIGWISSRPSPATVRRAEELKIDFLRQEKGSKVSAIEALLSQTGFHWDQVCYVGDDIVDLGALQRAGVSVVVADGVEEAKSAAHYVTTARGGHGAIREIIEMILRAQNKWAGIIAAYAA
jgi:3-deoxy-D-manno-octulosonate 8-phosphate phosphatase (KDO 8-P phosphatase)